MPLVALAGWVLPGLGHALLGQWRAATLMMGAILALYGGGLALTDFTAVDPERHGLEFIAHVFAGGPTALTTWLTDGHEPTRFLPYLDIGRLYVAVASLLNLVAITDAVEKTARSNHQVDTWRAQRRALVPASAVSEAQGLPTDQHADVHAENPTGFVESGATALPPSTPDIWSRPLGAPAPEAPPLDRTPPPADEPPSGAEDATR
jgi:hypothetical protein